MSEKITIEIASVPDREGLVAELWIATEQICEIRSEDGQFRVQLYPRQNGIPWDIFADSFVSAMNKAISALKVR